MNDSLYEIERKYDVGNITYKGICIWPILRIYIFENISFKSKSRTLKINPKIIFRFMMSITYGIRNYFIFNKFKILVFSSSERRKIFDNQWHDRVVEGLLTMYSKDSLLIENPVICGHKKKKEVPTANISSESVIFLISFIFGKLFLPKRINISNINILEKLLDEHNIEIDYNSILRRYISQYKVMKLLLRNSKLKAVCVVNSPTNAGYIWAFKEANIPVIEFQHGVVNANHYSYVYPTDIGNNFTPNYFLTYGEIEKRIFTKDNFFIDPKNVFATGYYFLDKMVNTNKNKWEPSLYKFEIAISSQTPFEDYSIPFIIEAAKMDESILYKIVLRENKHNYNYSFPKNVIISQKNIYEEISESNFHVSINSTCVIEALSIGVQNILIDWNGYASSYYKDIFNNDNFTIYVEKPSELVNKIKTTKRHTKEYVKNKNQSYFQNNYNQNIKSFFLENIDLSN